MVKNDTELSSKSSLGADKHFELIGIEKWVGHGVFGFHRYGLLVYCLWSARVRTTASCITNPGLLLWEPGLDNSA